MSIPCNFCQQDNTNIIFETPHNRVLLHSEGKWRGHIVIIPKQHIENFVQLSQLNDVAIDLQSCLSKIKKLCEKQLNFEPKYENGHLFFPILYPSTSSAKEIRATLLRLRQIPPNQEETEALIFNSTRPPNRTRSLLCLYGAMFLVFILTLKLRHLSDIK